MAHLEPQRTAFALLTATLTLAATIGEAHAAPQTTAAPKPETVVQGARVEWNEAWPRFRWWEYVATPLVLAGGLSLRLALDPPSRQWRGGILFDEAAQAAVTARVDGPERDFWGTLSDISFRASMVHPIIDAGLVAGIIHGEPDVAWQMFLIDLEGFAVTGLGVFALQALVARERPYGRDCGGSQPDLDCDKPDRWRSFPSGHIAIGVAGAALTCMHHGRMPLYGGKLWDAGACWVSVVLATGNAVGRVAANRHYVSDVLSGAAIGVLGGYVVPAALHYGFRNRARWNKKPSASASTSKTSEPVRPILITPVAGDGTVGVSALGAF